MTNADESLNSRVLLSLVDLFELDFTVLDRIGYGGELKYGSSAHHSESGIVKFKHSVAMVLQATIICSMVAENGALAADRKAVPTIVTFPSTSVGRVTIVRPNDNAERDDAVSKADARGQLSVPAGCDIHLELNYFGSQDTRFLLALPPQVVRKVDCAKLEMSDKEIANIGHLTRLADLDVECTDMTDAGLKQLSVLRDLRHLNIGGNAITARGLPSILGMKNLVWLRLSRNAELGDKIGPIVGRLTSLKSLDLCGAGVDNALLADLEPLTQLEELNLRRNNISDKGLVYIAKLKSLRELNCTDTLVTAKGLIVLAKLPKLNKVTFRMQDFKRDDLSRLRKAMPGVLFEEGSKIGSFPENAFAPLH